MTRRRPNRAVAGGPCTCTPPTCRGAEWLIEFAEDAFTWRRAHEKTTVALRGPPTSLMLAFNRRMTPDEGDFDVLGDRGLLDLWLERSSFG
ncbi:hypothetical protein GA0115235_116821 [Streptomyces sp. DpondAA-F4a]|nr:hypothetical protein GA0115235_116821 [Streptomyces sp. DpondAA-F4a]